MKKIAYLITLVFAFVITGCDDSTAGLTRITYYPELVLEGESTLYLDKGTTFEEPGYTAIMNGEDVTDEVEIFTNLDTNTSGVYTINYSIINADGFYTTASRTVIVTDPNDPIEGYWDTDPDSYRVSEGETAYGASYPVLIINNGDGTYSVDDLLGGWYCFRANYGTDYCMTGSIAISGNTVTVLGNSHIEGWGDGLDSTSDSKPDINQGTYNADTNTLYWHISYVNMDFHVTMYKR